MPNTATDARGLRWQFEWRTTLFVVVLVPVFLGLGSWQLSRADEKQAILDSWELRRQQAPAPLSALPEEPRELAHRRVILRGRYDAGRSFLLDNRIREGRYGVEVLTPLRLEASGLTVLVNRGWIEADPLRKELPDIAAPGMEVTLEGSIYVPPGEAYTLGAIAADDAWPRLIQAADMEVLRGMLDVALYPQQVRLAQHSPGALLADWPLVNVQPEKHQAYAAQWFAMAAALALLFVWRCSNLGALIKTRRSNDGRDQ